MIRRRRHDKVKCVWCQDTKQKNPFSLRHHRQTMPIGIRCTPFRIDAIPCINTQPAERDEHSWRYWSPSHIQWIHSPQNTQTCYIACWLLAPSAPTIPIQRYHHRCSSDWSTFIPLSPMMSQNWCLMSFLSQLKFHMMVWVSFECLSRVRSPPTSEEK